MKEQRFNSFFLSLLFCFMGILLPLQAFAQTKEAYGVLSEDEKTFTFRYDEHKPDHAYSFGGRVPGSLRQASKITAPQELLNYSFTAKILKRLTV